MKKKFGVDDLSAFDYYMEVDLPKGVQAISSFNVKTYRKEHPELQKQFGYDYEKYAEYYVAHPNSTAGTPSASNDKIVSVASNNSKTNTETDEVILFFEEETSSGTTSTTNKQSTNTKTTINGQKTLKTYLQNALVPCGRTLYIWGGGWDNSDASVIGYQSK